MDVVRRVIYSKAPIINITRNAHTLSLTVNTNPVLCLRSSRIRALSAIQSYDRGIDGGVEEARRLGEIEIERSDGAADDGLSVDRARRCLQKGGTRWSAADGDGILPGVLHLMSSESARSVHHRAACRARTARPRFDAAGDGTAADLRLRSFFYALDWLLQSNDSAVRSYVNS
ncbi:uncharacterized protein A4U43_C07F2460 [Asparagus officinalis]|uniref:Uncharacterized protein n=1 Tax=Asparagus officinalis TaxID=4686 RepID=A0A5P1E8W4_ASPOF|nr:uncharacterized protein A4U43_C07F2460 [Asparagus officinalis]